MSSFTRYNLCLVFEYDCYFDLSLYGTHQGKHKGYPNNVNQIYLGRTKYRYIVTFFTFSFFLISRKKSLNDSVVMSFLPKGQKSIYGKIREWGPAGKMISSPLMAYIVSHSKNGFQVQYTQTNKHQVIIWIYIGCSHQETYGTVAYLLIHYYCHLFFFLDCIWNKCTFIHPGDCMSFEFTKDRILLLLFFFQQ